MVSLVDQSVARFAGKADPSRNAGKSGNQCGFERIGQNQRSVVAAGCQLPCQLPAFLETQAAVSEGVVDDLADTRYAP